MSTPESSTRGTREASVSELLDYTIFFNDDNTLEWDPPVSSKELAIALSYHFPKEKSVEKKMQAATMKFLREEQRKSRDSVLTIVANGTSQPPNDHDLVLETIPSTGPLVASETSTSMGPPENQASTLRHIYEETPASGSATKILRPRPQVQDAPHSGGNGLKVVPWDSVSKDSNRGKKRRYGTEERRKVASNRGYACDDHRQQKVKCDPDICPRNKQRFKRGSSSRDSAAESALDGLREIQSSENNAIVSNGMTVLGPNHSEAISVDIFRDQHHSSAKTIKLMPLQSSTDILHDGGNNRICEPQISTELASTAKSPTVDSSILVPSQSPSSDFAPTTSDSVQVGLSELDSAWRPFSPQLDFAFLEDPLGSLNNIYMRVDPQYYPMKKAAEPEGLLKGKNRYAITYEMMELNDCVQGLINCLQNTARSC